jgi:hypothetical protein
MFAFGYTQSIDHLQPFIQMAITTDRGLLNYMSYYGFLENEFAL